MNIKDQLEIVQAAADGKQIEVYDKFSGKFLYKGLPRSHQFDFARHQYRIVKTGRERLIEDWAATEEFADLPLLYALSQLISGVLNGKYGELRDD